MSLSEYFPPDLIFLSDEAQLYQDRPTGLVLELTPLFNSGCLGDFWENNRAVSSGKSASPRLGGQTLQYSNLRKKRMREVVVVV